MRGAPGSVSGFPTAQVRPGLRGDPACIVAAVATPGQPRPPRRGQGDRVWSRPACRGKRPAHADPRCLHLVPGSRSPPSSDPGPTRAGLRGAEVERPHRAHGRGADGGFRTAEAQPPLTRGLLLSRRQEGPPLPQGRSPWPSWDRESAWSRCMSFRAWALSPAGFSGTLGPEISAQLSKEAPFPFPIKYPPRLLK